jgi:hypothetical protein
VFRQSTLGFVLERCFRIRMVGGELLLTLDYSIDRTGLLTEAAIDALCHVNICCNEYCEEIRLGWICEPYFVVLREPSMRVSLSIVIACAGHIASHNLQASKHDKKIQHAANYARVPIQRSSPLGYLRKACSPRKRGDSGPFSNGYIIVYGGLKNCSSTIHMPGVFFFVNGCCVCVCVWTRTS